MPDIRHVRHFNIVILNTVRPGGLRAGIFPTAGRRVIRGPRASSVKVANVVRSQYGSRAMRGREGEESQMRVPSQRGEAA